MRTAIRSSPTVHIVLRLGNPIAPDGDLVIDWLNTEKYEFIFLLSCYTFLSLLLSTLESYIKGLAPTI